MRIRSISSFRHCQQTVRHHALSQFRTAVVDGSSGAAYAEANFTTELFVVCNTLTAAFKSAESLDDPPDIILGSAPVLTFTTQHDHAGWRMVRAGHQPCLLTRENFSIVTGAARLHLDLERMKHRWLSEAYDPVTRVGKEGMAAREEDADAQARNHCYVGKPGFGRLRDLGRG